ncbi:kinesin light chain [Penicillium herquei]|nr:kinesin light chain [Penicillium herquei]
MLYFLNAISGILFLGTPFKGSGAARVARWAAHLSNASGKLESLKLIRILKEGNEKLNEVRPDFLITTREFQIPITYYYELIKTNLLKKVLPSFLFPWIPRTWFFFYKPIHLVELGSASLDEPNAIGLGVNHVCLNKFKSETCPRYGLVKSEILRHQEGIPSLMERRHEAFRQLIYLPRPPNPRFVGRVKFVQDLIDSICAKSSGVKGAWKSIWGLEGIGKTEVALKLAHQLSEVKDTLEKPIWSVFWVSASTEESLNEDYRALARRLHLNMDYDALSDKDLRKRVNEKLGMRPREWLFVVDDARDWLKPEYLPHGRNGTTLVTTGDHRVAQEMGTARKLEDLSEEEALDLLKQAFHSNDQENPSIDIDEQDAKELVRDRLRLHPLAIKLASEYIARQGTPIKEYIRTWDLDSGPEGTENWLITNIVNKVFAISLDRVTAKDPDVFAVLGRIAFLDQKNIPISLLNGLKDAKGFSISVQKVLDELVSYSFIIRLHDPELTPNSTDSIDVHELVQRAIKDRFKKDGTHDQKVTDEAILLAERLKLPTSHTKHEWSMEMGHVKSVLQHAEKAYQKEEGNSILPRIFEYGKPGWYLYYVVGQMHLLLGNQEQAEKYHRKALQLEQRDLTDKFFKSPIPTKHFERIDGHGMDLAATLTRSDDECLEDYLSRLSRALSEATALISNGSYLEAEGLLRKISQVTRDALGKTHPLAITSLTRLGQAQSLQGDWKEGAKTFEEVLNLQRELLPKGAQGSEKFYRAIFTSLETLAFTYQSDCDYVAAQERVEQAIEVLKNNLDDPRAILSCKEHLRLVLQQQGRQREAEELK